MSRNACWWCICLVVGLSAHCFGAERPTFNKDTCDPRPDILPYWLFNCPSEHRQTYNRPRYVMGWMAHVVEPSSQEAMVWCEAKQLGLYRKPHSPALCKRYYYPKPWELLDTGPRPDFAKADLNAVTEGQSIGASDSDLKADPVDDIPTKVKFANEILPTGPSKAAR